MDDSHGQEIIDEINEIIRTRHSFIKNNYLSIRDIFKNLYDWEELDSIRHEICLCIMFGMYQAAMTLTNHLLESLLKNSLITYHGRQVKQTKEQVRGKTITFLREKYSEGKKLYNDISLSKSINLAREKGLISDDQKITLHEFRENFRNAYSHADKNKTFGKSTMPVTAFRVDGNKIVEDESEVVEISDFLIGQGVIQYQFSQEHAIPYFLYIDKLIREIKLKVFSDDTDVKSV